jgi:hypothetical protein
MSERRHRTSDPDEPMMYQIRIEGHLGDHWSDWFDGLTILPQSNGETLLTGLVVDQAGLFGLLRKVRDFGLPLISVIRLGPDKTDRLDTTT